MFLFQAVNLFMSGRLKFRVCGDQLAFVLEPASSSHFEVLQVLILHVGLMFSASDIVLVPCWLISLFLHLTAVLPVSL